MFRILLGFPTRPGRFAARRRSRRHRAQPTVRPVIRGRQRDRLGAWIGWVSMPWLAGLLLPWCSGVAELVSHDLILVMLLAVGAIVGRAHRRCSALARRSSRSWSPRARSVAMLALVRPNLVKRLHAGPDLPARPRQARRPPGARSPRTSPACTPGPRQAGRARSGRPQPYDESPHHQGRRDRGGARHEGRHRLRPPRRTLRSSRDHSRRTDTGNTS